MNSLMLFTVYSHTEGSVNFYAIPVSNTTDMIVSCDYRETDGISLCLPFTFPQHCACSECNC